MAIGAHAITADGLERAVIGDGEHLSATKVKSKMVVVRIVEVGHLERW